MKNILFIILLVLSACGQEKSSQENSGTNSDSLGVEKQALATKARVTGSNVIIRTDHTTESPSAGVVARKGTIVQLLERYNSANSNEAILKNELTVTVNGRNINLSGGKAIRVLEDRGDSVRASIVSKDFGRVEAIIDKSNIEAIGGEKWYKVHTSDDITGWIYGKFIEEL